MVSLTSPFWNPEWIWGVCIVVLGLVLAGAMIFNRKRSYTSRAMTDDATRRRYDEQNREDEAAPR